MGLVGGLDLSGANFQSEVTVSLLVLSFFITSQVKNIKISIRTCSPTPGELCEAHTAEPRGGLSSLLWPQAAGRWAEGE